MLIQKFHPALQPGLQLALADSGNPLFSRKGHWDSGSALHCVAMALALLGKLTDPIALARRDDGPEAAFWDRAWPHYLHGLTPSELESFVWELNLGVRPGAAHNGQGSILNFCERELNRERPIVVGWRRRRARDAHAALVVGIEGRQHKRAFQPHALLLLDPAAAEAKLAACNARLVFNDERASYMTETHAYPVTVENAVSIRPIARHPAAVISGDCA
ncbi:hypothetical protein GO287_02057 [Ralstonia solanacearum]|uniref:hypothetical protein n=1 Tax=Ralstonia pseudosolanacearum TaxID=1310165 RepID=UPI001401DEC4|nr:hypothetical protein [Ralstonia pseudosolanacearum]KAF3461281.1 hypothetical protein GO278_000781 [Ralstonia solanacearum]NKA77497.1 hypothetical protein [Ralstonia solanacearum]NKG00131.1 hypothetical protein [Ralstonia solanacearum]NKG04852.1 hypothetical protein [Ralstonia solanacearum]UNJ30250.1 hypothetical protein MNY32_02730 [Ralstonia pseudosolanacearum]